MQPGNRFSDALVKTDAGGSQLSNALFGRGGVVLCHAPQATAGQGDSKAQSLTDVPPEGNSFQDAYRDGANRSTKQRLRKGVGPFLKKNGRVSEVEDLAGDLWARQPQSCPHLLDDVSYVTIGPSCVATRRVKVKAASQDT